MKTKFLRLAKLPKIEPQKEQQTSPDHNYLSHNSLNRTDSLKHNELLTVLETLLKKNKPTSTYEMEPRDRSVVVDLPEVDEGEELPDEILKNWIAEVCTKVVSCAFNLLSSDQLSYEQTKVSCSEGILRNVVLLVEKYQLNKRQIKLLNEHIEKNIINYLKRKYPMTESTDVNKALDEAVKAIDNSEAQENDLLQNSNVVFTYRESGNYNDLIMTFLNEIMTQLDSRPQEKIQEKASSKVIHHPLKTVFQQFFDTTSQLFENVYNERWMTKKSRDSILNSNIPSQILIEKTEEINEKYASSVKEYTHYMIGRKIPKSVPVYTAEEISEGYLMIKSPAILRILTKWCDELWKKFNKKNYFLDRQENVRVQEKGGNVNTMFMWMKIPLNDLVENEKYKIQEFMSDIQENNFDQQTQLLKQELFENDGFYHVEKFEKVCGKFATKTVSNLHSYIVLYLNRLIHGLLYVSKELYENRLSTKARWTSAPDLITFKIGDLMRCKCSSKEREILMIYKELESISVMDPDRLKIIRVKNRLKLGTNDILINVLFNKKYLCEIQLAVKSAQSKFISCSNQFNHYIYELGRTIFGPLTELCSVWISLDPRAGEYEFIINNEKPKVHSQQPVCPESDRHKFNQYVSPFICSNCNLSYSHTNYFWEHRKCKNKNCNYIICAKCRLEKEDEQSLKSILLKDYPQLLEVCSGIVNRKQEHQQKMPNYGVCIPINSKKVKVQKFKMLEYKKIMTVYGLKIVKGQEKAFMIDELIKKSSERKFLKKYLVFEIPDDKGSKLIDITLERAKQDYIIPQKVKEIYKKEKEIMSLIEENLDDKAITIMEGPKEGMDNIRNMQLADNCLTKIDFITANFPNLQRLQLSRNKVDDISGISNLIGLVKLNLRNNNLVSLPDQICFLSLLQGINIRNNKIKKLPQNFGKLKFLNKLESDNNLISELPESFKDLQNLKFINLSKNKLTQFPEHIRNFKKLKQLYFSKNKIKVLPEWIENFKDVMVTLDLSKTGLTNFPKELYQLTKLEIFKIQSSYHQLDPQIGNLQRMQELYIQMPNIKKIPDEIFQMESLKTLQIEDCQMEELPECLSEMKKLTQLHLINNHLKTLSKEVSEMTKLRGLMIEGQDIDTLPIELKNLTQLRTLSLNKNKFKIFPKVVLEFKKLFQLCFKDNELQQVPHNIHDLLPELEEVELDNNKLKVLPSSLKFARKLKNYTFQKNPLTLSPWIINVIQMCKSNAEGDITFLKKTQSINMDDLRSKINNEEK